MAYGSVSVQRHQEASKYVCEEVDAGHRHREPNHRLEWRSLKWTAFTVDSFTWRILAHVAELREALRLTSARRRFSQACMIRPLHGKRF